MASSVQNHYILQSVDPESNFQRRGIYARGRRHWRAMMLVVKHDIACSAPVHVLDMKRTPEAHKFNFLARRALVGYLPVIAYQGIILTARAC